MHKIPPHMVMILGCSKDKVPDASCAAGDMYLGSIYKKGKAIAVAHGIPYYILSAKYGFLKPTTVIDNYDQKFAKPFAGPFPPEPWHGFVLGGTLYFKHAPMRFQKLVPSLQMGYMLQALKKLENDPEAVQDMIGLHIAMYPS